MIIHTVRLCLGIFFLLAGGCLLTRHWIAPTWFQRYDPLRMNLGAAFALVFGLLNVVRWYVVWSRRQQLAVPVRTPLQPDPSLVQPQIRPEFDFFQAPIAQHPSVPPPHDDNRRRTAP
jgi:hypothetical protein